MKRKILLITFIGLYNIALFSEEIPSFDDIQEIPELEYQKEASEVEISEDSKSFAGHISYIQSQGLLVIDKQLKGLKNDFKITSLMIIILFSFLYGVVHTLGPGHGKMIIFSYFLSEETTRKDTAALAALIPLIHSLGAILLALMLKTILSFVTGFTVVAIQYSFTVLSGLLVVAISLYLIFHKDKSKEFKVSKSNNIILKNLPVAISVGIVPCPLSLTIMSTSIIYGIFWIGFSAVAAITIAMTIILYFIAFFATKSQNGIKKRQSTKVYTFFHRAGEVVLLSIGLMFIYNGGKALWPIVF